MRHTSPVEFNQSDDNFKTPEVFPILKCFQYCVPYTSDIQPIQWVWRLRLTLLTMWV